MNIVCPAELTLTIWYLSGQQRTTFMSHLPYWGWSVSKPHLSDLLRRPFEPSFGDGAESPQGKYVCQSTGQLGSTGGRKGKGEPWQRYRAGGRDDLASALWSLTEKYKGDRTSFWAAKISHEAHHRWGKQVSKYVGISFTWLGMIGIFLVRLPVLSRAEVELSWNFRLPTEAATYREQPVD